MTKVMNFSENLEKNLARLGHDVAKRAELPESRDLSERELVRESIRSMVQPEEQVASNPSAKSTPSAPTPAQAPSSNGNFLPNYLSDNGNESVKKSVEHLLQLAVDGDITKAVKEAKRYPPFIEDAFHDALIDKFLPELKKRGAIK